MSATGDIQQQTNEISVSNKDISEMEQAASDVDSVQIEQPNLDSTSEVLQTEKSCDNVDKDRDNQECESLQIELAQDIKDAHTLEPSYSESSVTENPLSTVEIDSINNITEKRIEDLADSIEQYNTNDNSSLKNSDVVEGYQASKACSEDILPLNEVQLIDIGENYNTSNKNENLVKNESMPVLFSEGNVSKIEEMKASDNIEEFIPITQISSNATDGNLLHFDEINEHQNLCTTEEKLSVLEVLCEEKFSEAEVTEKIVDNTDQNLNSSKNSNTSQNEKVYLDNILEDFPGDKVAVDEHKILDDINQSNNKNDITDNQPIVEKIDVDICTSSLTTLEEAEVINISDNSEIIDQINIIEKVSDLQTDKIVDNDHTVNLPIDKTIIVNNVLDEDIKINENIDDSNDVKSNIVTNISNLPDKIEDLNLNEEVIDNYNSAKLSEDSIQVQNTDTDNNSNLSKEHIVTDDKNLLTEKVLSTCTSDLKTLEKIDSTKTSEISDNIQQNCITDKSLVDNKVLNVSKEYMRNTLIENNEKEALKVEDISNKSTLDNHSDDLIEKVVTNNDNIKNYVDNKHFSNCNDELIATNISTPQYEIIDIKVEPLISNETNKIDNETLLKTNEKFSDISEQSVNDQLNSGKEVELKNEDPIINKSVDSENKVKSLISNQTNINDEKKPLKSREDTSNTPAKVIKSSNNVKLDVHNTCTRSSVSASDNSTVPNMINKLQNMNWLRSQPSFEANMSRKPSVKIPLKILPKKDERSEDYFEGTKKSANNRRRNSGQGKNKNSRSNISTLDVNKDDTPGQSSGDESKYLQDQNASTSTTVWNANTANKLFPDVQSVVIDRAKEEDDFNQAVLESICTAQKESEKRKKSQGALKIHIQDEDNDEWGKIHRNLPDDVPKEATNINVSETQNPGPSFVDKYGRVDGYSEKRLFMGRGGRRREQEFLKAQTENKPQFNQNQPSSFQTLPPAKKILDQTNSQHMDNTTKESDLHKTKEVINTCQQVVSNKKDSLLPSKNQEPRSIHGRFGKEDGFVDTKWQKPGFRQEISKDVNQNLKVNQIPGRNSGSNNDRSNDNNGRNLNNSYQNQNYQDKNRTDSFKNNYSDRNQQTSNRIQETSKVQEVPNRIQDIQNKNLPQNQSSFNRPQNHTDLNRSVVKGRQDNFNKSHTDNRVQENTNRNNDFHNRNQNHSNANREVASRNQSSNKNQENTNKCQEDNWNDNEEVKTNLQKHFSTTQRPTDNQKDTRNQTNDQNSQRYSSSTVQHNQRDTRNQTHDTNEQRYSNNTQQHNFNQRDPRNSSHDSNIQKNFNQRDPRNPSYDSSNIQKHSSNTQPLNQRDTRNSSYDSSNIQKHSSNTQSLNQRDTRNSSHDTNVQRYSSNTQQQAYNQRDNQVPDSKLKSQQNMNFEQQRNSESQNNKISNISQNAHHNSQTNVKKEKDYVNPNLSINNVDPKEQSKSLTISKSSVETNRTFNHPILTSAAPTATLAQIKSESQQSALKPEASITFGTVQENTTSELRPNVVMSFEGNQNVQRALGLNPNLFNPVKVSTTNQISTVNETPTSTRCNTLNVPSHVTSSMMSHQNHPTAQFSQHVACAHFNPSVMHPNSLMQADAPLFEAPNSWQNQGLQSQFPVGMETAVPNMPYELSPASNNNTIDQQLRMNEISNESLEFMQLHSNVATLSKQLAAAQAALLAAQWKYHQASNASNIQSQVADLNITANNNQTINQAMPSRVVQLPANFMPVKVSVPPGFTASMPPPQKSMVDDTMEVPKNFAPVNMQEYLNERYLSNHNIEQRLNFQTMYAQQNNLLQQQQAMHFQQYNIDGRGRIIPQNNEPGSQRSGGNQFYNQ